MSSTYTLLFFFLSTAPPLFYTLSLHDALPIFDLVLAGVAVLLQGFEVVLGSAAHAADRNAGVLRLGAREAHVVAATLLSERGQHDSDDVAIVGGVDAEVGIPQCLDDPGVGGAVVGRDENGAGFGDGQRAQLLQRGGSFVVVDEDVGEHPSVGSAAADLAELLPRDLDRPGHLLLGFEDDVINHRFSFMLSSCRAGSRSSTVTSVPILSPLNARVTLPGVFIPNTLMSRPFSMHSEKAATSTTLIPRRSASS